MGNIDKLLTNYQLHKKSRTQKHACYPVRFYIPDDKVKWDLVIFKPATSKKNNK
jgi:hypothetical protein